MQPTDTFDQTRHGDLRYVSARGLTRQVMDLDRLEVQDTSGDNLGEVEGFLVETSSGRPRYVVVDSGGWFRTRRYLLPVEHARFDPARRGLTFAGGRGAIQQFPDVADDRIESLRSEELAGYDRDVTRACCPDDEDFRRFELERHDDSPAWWRASAWTTVPGAPGVSAAGAVDERLAAEARERWRPADDERAVADPNERAQPGDVIGIETGGETTGIGDTAEDEDRRRERADNEMRRDRDGRPDQERR